MMVLAKMTKFDCDDDTDYDDALLSGACCICARGGGTGGDGAYQKSPNSKPQGAWEGRKLPE